VIAEVVRGNAMPDLVSYLFGPGRHNEHVNQHLIAGYADAVFTADDKLWQSEPKTRRHLRAEARELGWQVEYPHSRWGSEVPHGYVWHCSLSIRADEGQLTDAQWTEASTPSAFPGEKESPRAGGSPSATACPPSATTTSTWR
jgi:hypothetical protein